MHPPQAQILSHAGLLHSTLVVTILPFTSPIGSKVTIPESPSDTFQLMLTPALFDSIVEGSNVYAKEV